MFEAIRRWSLGVDRIADQISDPGQERQYASRQLFGTEVVNPIHHDETTNGSIARNCPSDGGRVPVNPASGTRVKKASRTNDRAVDVEAEALCRMYSTQYVAKPATHLHHGSRL